jgi:hypothetical protein
MTRAELNKLITFLFFQDLICQRCWYNSKLENDMKIIIFDAVHNIIKKKGGANIANHNDVGSA